MRAMSVPIWNVLRECRSGYWGNNADLGQLNVRVVRNGDISASGVVRWDRLPLRGFTSVEAARSQIAPGDLVLTTSGNCGQIALVDRAPTEVTCVSNFLRVLRVDDAKADSSVVRRESVEDMR